MCRQPKFLSFVTVVNWIAALGVVLSSVSPAMAEVTEAHRQVVQSIFDRVVEVAEEPDDWDAWPPKLVIEDNPKVNALAGPASSGRKRLPQITVYRGLIDLFESNEDQLAPTICHEFQHLLRIHTHKHQDRLDKFGELGAAAAVLAVTREEELEADFCGMELAMDAGFSRAGVRANYQAMMQLDSSRRYSPFEALMLDHPTWEERAAYMERGTTHEPLWRAMVAFRNGVHFLNVEDYVHAAFCFRMTVEEFPGFCEGWTNLGHAYLMQACDQLDVEQIERLGIGHLAEGVFFVEPESLIAMCTCDDQEVEDARGHHEQQPVPLDDFVSFAHDAFREARTLTDRLVSGDGESLLNANEALACLLVPEQHEEARTHFDKALERLRESEPEAVSPYARAAMFVNATAALRESGEQTQAEALISEANRAIRRANNSRVNGKRQFDRSRIERLSQALVFNAGVHKMRTASSTDELKGAEEQFAKYLNGVKKGTHWWEAARTKLTDLAARTGSEFGGDNQYPQPEPSDWLEVSAVVMPDGHLLGLAEPTPPSLRPLGNADEVVSVVSDDVLRRHNYAQSGVAVLGCRETISIFLTSEKAPPIRLSRPGLGGTTAELRVGMPRQDLEALIGDEWTVDYISIDDPDVVYHMYRSLNVAVLYDGGKVSELVLVVVPVQ